MGKKEELRIGEQRDGIWRRSEDCYIVRVVVDGKRHSINAGSDYQAALLLALETRKRKTQERLTGRNELIKELFKTKSTVTLGELIDRYIAVKSPILKPLTIRFYKGIIHHFDPIKKREVDSLKIGDVTKFIMDLQVKQLSPKTINHVLVLGRTVANFGIRHELTERNVFKDVGKVREIKHEPMPFSKEELRKIFAALDPHFLPYFLLQASTGIRTGELLALKWRNFSWHNNLLYINKSRWGKIEESTKTKDSDRYIHLPPNISALLKQLQEDSRADDQDYVVVNKSGKPYQIYLHKYWQRALTAAGVPYRSNYVLRSTFASLALADGADLAFISKCLGHTSIKITADKYLRYLSDADKANKEKLAAMVGGFTDETPSL
jgi:integrase